MISLPLEGAFPLGLRATGAQVQVDERAGEQRPVSWIGIQTENETTKVKASGKA